MQHYKNNIYLVANFTDINWVIIAFLFRIFICPIWVFPCLTKVQSISVISHAMTKN